MVPGNGSGLRFALPAALPRASSFTLGLRPGTRKVSSHPILHPIPAPVPGHSSSPAQNPFFLYWHCLTKRAPRSVTPEGAVPAPGNPFPLLALSHRKAPFNENPEGTAHGSQPHRGGGPLKGRRSGLDNKSKTQQFLAQKRPLPHWQEPFCICLGQPVNFTLTSPF